MSEELITDVVTVETLVKFDVVVLVVVFICVVVTVTLSVVAAVRANVVEPVEYAGWVMFMERIAIAINVNKRTELDRDLDIELGQHRATDLVFTTCASDFSLPKFQSFYRMIHLGPHFLLVHKKTFCD